MKKLVALLFAACLMLPTVASAAEYGVYVAPKIGVGIQHLKVGIEPDDLGEHVSGNKAVFGGGLALGYDFQTKFAFPVRMELEYLYWANASKSKSGEYAGAGIHGKGTVGIQSLFANVYYDFHNSTAFTPYIGAGLGIGFVKTKGHIGVTIPGVGDGWVEASKTKAKFAWNVGLGCAYAFNDMISADLSYRYASFGSGETDSWNEYHFKSSRNDMHQFMLGLRFTF